MRMINILYFETKFYRKFKFLKKLCKYNSFIKKKFKRLKIKFFKSYSKNIMNFIRYSRIKPSRKKWRIKWLRKYNRFTSLHFSYVTYCFKLIKIFYETFYTHFFNDLAIVIRTDRVLTPRHRYNLMRYLKRPILNYRLFPYVRKFYKKIKRRMFFQSVFYFKESNDFHYKLKWNFMKLSLFTLKFYNNDSFLFLIQNLKK